MLIIRRNRWGKLKQIYVPSTAFHNGTLAVSPAGLAVLIVLLQIHKVKPNKVRMNETIATVRVGHKTLIARTGYSQNSITKAIQELTLLQYIQVKQSDRKKHGQFATQEYVLCNPADGSRLQSSERNVFRSLLYFTFPQCVVTEKDQHWSLANMTSSQLKVYASLLYRATRKDNNIFESTPAELRKATGISKYSTLGKATDGLERRGLILIDGSEVQLCNPYTGVPLGAWEGAGEDNPWNYYETGKDNRAKQLVLNTGDAAAIEMLIRSSLPEGEIPVLRSSGEMMIRCPFHADTNPSCSVNVNKNGCFQCFGCHEKGNIRKLLGKLTDISQAEAVQELAAALGKSPEYHDPESKIIAKYQYTDGHGKLIKEVVRYPNNSDGSKNIKQRRPAKGGDWIWNTEGVPPLLFNFFWLKNFGDTVVVTEGEKDATTVMDLGLKEEVWNNEVVGTTSGGADSWDSRLAKHLVGKRVVLMPDADASGQRYADAVKASLEAEGIEYRVVTFGDVGAKDVTDSLEEHSVEELVRRIGVDWVCMPDGTRLFEYGEFTPWPNNYQNEHDEDCLINLSELVFDQEIPALALKQ